MKYSMLIFVLAILVAGCSNGNTESNIVPEQRMTQTITTDGGDTVTVTGTANPTSWCPEGGDWTMTTSAQSGTEGTMKIDKIITSGKYIGLCHVVYTMNSPEGSYKADYYFSEDGKSGWFIMDMNGQKIEQRIEG